MKTRCAHTRKRCGLYREWYARKDRLDRRARLGRRDRKDLQDRMARKAIKASRARMAKMPFRNRGYSRLYEVKMG